MTGAERIAAERQRQIDVEGWTPQHDALHPLGDLIDAALCYAEVGHQLISWSDPTVPRTTPAGWPWDDEWWKPSDDPVRMLVKAGALIAAEIDRLLRAAPTPEEGTG